MNTVYCITNLINNKQYVGSTIIEPEKRYKQHIYASKKKSSNKYNYPLYNAMRKYGLENFKFEIIEQLDCSEEEIRKIEQKYIIKYNTLCPNGYNQTIDTLHPINDINSYKKMSESKREKHSRVAEVDENDNIIKIWRSITDLADEYNVKINRVSDVCNGKRHTTSNKIFRYIDNDNNIIYNGYVGNSYNGNKGTTNIQKNSKSVLKIDLKTNIIIDIYDTCALAGRENNCDASSIAKVCNNKQNSCGGYRWQYANINNYIGEYIENTYVNKIDYKPVLQYDKYGNFLAEYSSLCEAEKATGADRSNIKKVCEHKKNYNTAKGYIWKYKEQEE